MHGVIDLAAISNDPSGDLDPTKTWSINHLGRLRIATLAKQKGVKRYIFPSSCSIYGFQEEEVNEKSSTNPLTTYAKANLKAEEDILELANEDFCVTILRQATVYGYSKRMRFDLAVNGMIKGFFVNKKIPLLRNGSQWRPFVHVKDTSKAMLMVLKANEKQVQKEIFNVGSNQQNYQVLNLAEKIAKATKINFEYEWYGSPDHRSYKVNFNKIKEVLGFNPDHDVNEGAIEVWENLISKKLDPHDKSTITVEWYKKLMDSGVEI